MATITQPQTYPIQPVSTWESLKRGVRASGLPWLFVLPSIVVMLIITFTPQAYQIGISFRDFAAENLGGAPASYVGLENFRQVLNNQINVVNYDFFPLLGFNIVWTVINVAFHVIIGLAVALALNAEHVLGRRIYRVIFVLPWALPGYITALIWNNLWQQNSGGINLLFQGVNESLGTMLPTRTAWLTELNPPINLLPIIPYLVVIVCAGLALWMGYRTLKSGGLTEELDAHKAAPVFTLADIVATVAALLMIVGFFFLPFVSANGVEASGFNLLWNFSVYNEAIDRQLLLIPLFVSMIAIATAVWGLLDVNARPVARIIMLVAGIAGAIYFALYFINAGSYPNATPTLGFWLALAGVVASIAQYAIPRPMHINATGVIKRVSIGKSVVTVGAIVLLSLAALGTLTDVISNGSQASNAVIDLFERAGAPKLAFFAVLIANIWLGWPFMMVVATGALQSIPPDLYEAADVDGASKWKQFSSITLPLLRPAMVPAIMLGTVWTFNAFNVIFFITAGGPRNQTDLLVTQSYKLIQQEQVYGAAAAFSIIVFFILLVITLIQNRVTQATKSYDEA